MLSRLALIAALAAVPVAAQPSSPQPSSPQPSSPPPVAAVRPPGVPLAVPKADLVKVVIETSAGRIVIALGRGRAPLTVANFLRYVDAKRYDRQTFYRAMPNIKGGLIQGGITSDARLLFKPVAHEPTSTTGLKHVRGTVAMARLEPGSARSDFFILTEDIAGFDATTADPGFAAFGSVVEGMEVVDKIFAAPRSAIKGAGAMKGQMLEPAVKILRMARVR